MAAATSATTQVGKPDPNGVAVQIANSDAMYHGRFAGIRGSTHATSQGDAADYDNEPGMIFAGLAHHPGGLSTDTGDTSATVPPTVGLDVNPRILSRVTVTGASAITDQWSPVYATSNADLTLTRPAADAEVVGFVSKWHVSTTCDVLLLGLIGQLILGMAGGNRTVIDLGHYDNADLADGDIRTGFAMPFAGKFISLHGNVEAAFTGVSGTATVNLEIGGTNVTGGALVVSTAAGGTVGTQLDATAITAANTFSTGDLLDIEVSSAGGTQTLGRVGLFAVVERLPGC